MKLDLGEEIHGYTNV